MTFRVESLRFPDSVNIALVQERLSKMGFVCVTKTERQGHSILGSSQSYLILSRDEERHLRESSQALKKARRVVNNAVRSGASFEKQQRRFAELNQARQERDELVELMKAQFLSRLSRVLRVSDLLQEDYMNPSSSSSSVSSSVEGPLEPQEPLESLGGGPRRIPLSQLVIEEHFASQSPADSSDGALTESLEAGANPLEEPGLSGGVSEWLDLQDDGEWVLVGAGAGQAEPVEADPSNLPAVRVKQGSDSEKAE